MPNTGTVVQVVGPVLDIRFPDGQLPNLNHAVTLKNGDRTIVAEVAQQIGDGIVRCVAMMVLPAAQKPSTQAPPLPFRSARLASVVFST